MMRNYADVDSGIRRNDSVGEGVTPWWTAGAPSLVSIFSRRELL
jgi:hypothetical protein